MELETRLVARLWARLPFDAHKLFELRVSSCHLQEEETMVLRRLEDGADGLAVIVSFADICE